MIDPYIDKTNLNLIEGVRTLKLKDSHRRFPYDGVISFCGEQGSGKSLSAYRFMSRLKEDFPFLTFVSNEDLSGFTEYVKYENPGTIEALDTRGIVLFLDEITNMPNLTSLDSKSLPREWFSLLNMQRKRELLIITTCPVFQRIAKPFREQIDTVVLCKNIGTLQINRYCKLDYDSLLQAESAQDIISGLKIVRRHIFFHSRKDYARFNTLTLISNGKEKNIKDGC